MRYHETVCSRPNCGKQARHKDFSDISPAKNSTTASAHGLNDNRTPVAQDALIARDRVDSPRSSPIRQSLNNFGNRTPGCLRDPYHYGISLYRPRVHPLGDSLSIRQARPQTPPRVCRSSAISDRQYCPHARIAKGVKTEPWRLLKDN